MPTHLSLDDLKVIGLRHDALEFAHDLDALMKTVHPKPCWIVEPIGVEITTHEAVAENYRRIFTLIDTIRQSTIINFWFAEDGFMAEVDVTRQLPDGSEISTCSISWGEFNGDLVSGEARYLDMPYANLIAQTFGESFFTYPGVSRL